MYRNIECTETVITDWLRDEEPYQFGNNLILHTADALPVIDGIVTKVVPNHWTHFQLNNIYGPGNKDTSFQRQANLHLMKACAAARGALAFSYFLEGKDADQDVAIARTRASLAMHFNWLREDESRYPALGMLAEPLTVVVHPAEPIEGLGTKDLEIVFKNLAGVTLVHLANSDVFTLPLPPVGNSASSSA